jgi:hypothetical protein
MVRGSPPPKPAPPPSRSHTPIKSRYPQGRGDFMGMARVRFGGLVPHPYRQVSGEQTHDDVHGTICRRRNARVRRRDRPPIAGVALSKSPGGHQGSDCPKHPANTMGEVEANAPGQQFLEMCLSTVLGMSNQWGWSWRLARKDRTPSVDQQAAVMLVRKVCASSQRVSRHHSKCSRHGASVVPSWFHCLFLTRCSGRIGRPRCEACAVEIPLHHSRR